MSASTAFSSAVEQNQPRLAHNVPISSMLANVAANAGLPQVQNGLLSVVTAASPTISASQLLGGVVKTITANGTKTLDTAANIVAAMPGCKVGSVIRCYYLNLSGGTDTIAFGSGITSLSSTLTVSTSRACTITLVITNTSTPAAYAYINTSS